MEKYDTLVLVSGGSGIADVLPLLRQVDNSRRRKVNLLWSCKRAAMIDSILARERGGEFDHFREGVKLDLHAARDRSNMKEEGAVEGVVIREGRLNAREVIGDGILNRSGGRVAVVACGPAGMAVRREMQCIACSNKRYFNYII